jgi:hypothetical protein
MNDYYGSRSQWQNGDLTQIEKDGISVRVKRELKTITTTGRGILSSSLKDKYTPQDSWSNIIV